MAKSFKELWQKMPKHRRELNEKKAQEILEEMHLQELRQKINISQEQMAEFLSTKQANISRMERRSDMYISSLRSFIEAMGGKLDMIARFPEGDIYIQLFKKSRQRRKKS